MKNGPEFYLEQDDTKRTKNQRTTLFPQRAQFSGALHQKSCMQILSEGGIPMPDCIEIMKVYWAYTSENYEKADRLTDLPAKDIPEAIKTSALATAQNVMSNFQRNYHGIICEILLCAIMKYVYFKEARDAYTGPVNNQAAYSTRHRYPL